MKKTILAAASLLLIAGNIAIAEPTAADQKWLTVVQKMVEQGKTQFSTTSQDRVELAKNWAQKNSYSVVIKKTDAGFKLEFSRSVAKN